MGRKEEQMRPIEQAQDAVISGTTAAGGAKGRVEPAGMRDLEPVAPTSAPKLGWGRRKESLEKQEKNSKSEVLKVKDGKK